MHQDEDETRSGAIRGAAASKPPMPCVWQWVPGVPCDEYLGSSLHRAVSM